MLSKGIQFIINAKCSSIRHQANSITVGTHYIERLQIQWPKYFPDANKLCFVFGSLCFTWYYKAKCVPFLFFKQCVYLWL